MRSSTNNASKSPKKTVDKPLNKLTKYELIILSQKQGRALKRAEKQIQRLNDEVNRTITECDKDFARIGADLDRVKQDYKVLEVNQLKERNTLLSLLSHAQMELQLAQVRYVILQQKHGVTPSLTEEAKLLRVGQSSLTMGFLYHEQVKN